MIELNLIFHIERPVHIIMNCWVTNVNVTLSPVLPAKFLFNTLMYVAYVWLYFVIYDRFDIDCDLFLSLLLCFEHIAHVSYVFCIVNECFFLSFVEYLQCSYQFHIFCHSYDVSKPKNVPANAFASNNAIVLSCTQCYNKKYICKKMYFSGFDYTQTIKCEKQRLITKMNVLITWVRKVSVLSKKTADEDKLQ